MFLESPSSYPGRYQFPKACSFQRLRKQELQLTLLKYDFKWTTHIAWKSIIFFISNLLLTTFPICRWPWCCPFPNMVIIHYPSTISSTLKLLYSEGAPGDMSGNKDGRSPWNSPTSRARRWTRKIRHSSRNIWGAEKTQGAKGKGYVEAPPGHRWN